METEYLPKEFISKLSARTNIYSTLGKVFVIDAIRTDHVGNATIDFVRTSRTPLCSIREFLDFRFCKVPMNPDAISDPSKAIGIIYLECGPYQAEPTESEYNAALTRIQKYGEKHYSGKYQIVSDSGQLVFIVQLSDNEYEEAREQYFVTTLKGTDLGKTLRKSVKADVPLIAT